MKHQMEIEERYFSQDITSLMEYDHDFKSAYENGVKYKLEISLDLLAKLCPRKFQKKQMYERLTSFLRQKGIMLIIVSRKREKKEKHEDLSCFDTCDSSRELSDNEARGKNDSQTGRN